MKANVTFKNHNTEANQKKTMRKTHKEWKVPARICWAHLKENVPQRRQDVLQ